MLSKTNIIIRRFHNRAHKNQNEYWLEKQSNFGVDI